MEGIMGWLFSIVGIVFLGVIIDVILPNGQTNKYIKAIFGFVIILVIVMPLKNIDSIEYAFDDLFNSSEIEIDENYVYNCNRQRVDKLAENIVDLAEKDGLLNIEVQILSNIYEYDLEITGVKIFLNNLVIDENYTHIDKYKLLQEIVQAYINIDEESIEFYE